MSPELIYYIDRKESNLSVNFLNYPSYFFSGNDNKLINRILDPFYLSQVAKIHKAVQYIVQKFGPWSIPWVGESGGAYNSGGKDISDSFVNTFW